MKKKFIFKILSVGICLCLSLSACGTASKNANKGNVNYPKGGTYPLESEDVLTVWANGYGHGIEASRFGAEWKKETGVNFEIQEVAGSTEALSLLLASGNLPDVLITTLDRPTQYLESDTIIDLTPHLGDWAPNLKKYLDDNPDVSKLVKSDSGQYYTFPFIRGDELLCVSQGLVLRKDILDKGDISVPETIDQWHDALRYFKNNGINEPLFAKLNQVLNSFAGAYGTQNNFYLKDNKVTHGLLEPEMKEVLKTLNTWYNEGLISKNIVSITDMDSKVLNSEVAVIYGYAGSALGKYINAARQTGKSEAEFDLYPAPFPVLNKGEQSPFGSTEFAAPSSNNGYITTACKNVELAMRLLDFAYSEKGHMFFNFGVEGESYNMVDGYPTYTEIITKNPEGLPMSQALFQQPGYALASGPFIQDVRYIEQYYSLPQQKAALTMWSKTDGVKNMLPVNYMSFDSEDVSKINRITNNVTTYADEYLLKFIMGLEPLEQYENFVSQVKAYGLEDLMPIYQSAYQRYNQR